MANRGKVSRTIAIVLRMLRKAKSQMSLPAAGGDLLSGKI